MSLPLSVLVIAVLVISTIKTVSFAAWNWKNGNKTGALFIFLVCLASLALPAYAVFYKS